MDTPLVKDPVAIFLTIITIILVAPLVMERLKLPGLVGIIVGGMIIGPNGLHLLSVDPAVELLATVGLIYLMFSVGLEIDLPQFRRIRNRAMTFGLLAFTFPLGAGLLLGRLNGFSWASSILLGSLIASQALINYPLLSRMGILRNEAVSVSIGATLFTDVAALILLAVTIRLHEGDLSAAGLVYQLVLMAVYILFIMLALPRIGNYFFRRQSERSVEFQFVLAALFVAALLAELIHMHAIVGAFLAGLAINSALPPRSAVVNRIVFMGESFFIPIFFLYIGMIIDPWVVFGGTRTLYVGGSMLVALWAMKLLAAWLTATLFHYDRDELMTSWGISHAEASAALVILLLGAETGLLNQNVLNAGVLLVLVTCISSPLVVQHYGARLRPSPSSVQPSSYYERIIIGVDSTRTQERLIDLAGILARTVQGKLLPLHVILDEGSETAGSCEEHDAALESEALDEPETSVERISRIDASLSDGIIHAAMENQATMIFMGWQGRSRLRDAIFGSAVDQVILRANVPVLAGRFTSPINAIKRIVLLALPRSAGLKTPDRAFEPALIIAEALGLPVLVLTDEHHVREVSGHLRSTDNQLVEEIITMSRVSERNIQEHLKPQDLLIYPSADTVMRTHSFLNRLPGRLAEYSQASMILMILPILSEKNSTRDEYWI